MSVFNPSVQVRFSLIASDQTNGTGTPASTTLTMPLAPNATYAFQASLYFTCSTSSVNVQLHAMAAGAAVVFVNDSNAAAGDLAVTSTGANIMTTAKTGANCAAFIYGLITVGTTATTLQIDFLDPLTTGTTTAKANSWLEVIQVA